MVYFREGVQDEDEALLRGLKKPDIITFNGEV